MHWLACIFALFLSQMAWATNAEQVLVLVNQQRHRHHLPALTMNTEMSQTALQHSRNMAAHRVPFGHQGFKQRIRHLFHVLPGARAGAENVAYNYTSAQHVVEGWMRSRGHRKNILGRYNLTGIGIAEDAKHHLVYTQLFIRMEPHD
jgi:uncharacterized protein YkwD